MEEGTATMWWTIVVILLLWPPPFVAGLEFEEARHLLARTSFGGTPADVEALLPLTHEAAVDRLLSGVHQQPRTAPPAWVDEPAPTPLQRRTMSDEERKAFREQVREHGLALKGWWYHEMLSTDSPLTERMTLFWHNHFTSGLQKVQWPALLYQQNLLLRQHAVGNLRLFLHAIAKDPAMILYLDSQTNRQGVPNENFARELLELFTLGEGHYSEQDIKEAARAFTGWEVERRTGRFHYNASRHDDGPKTFLGRSGAFDGDAILDILLTQSRLAVHLTEKLWRVFISDTPDGAEVQRLAALFRQHDYDLKPLLKALFMSSHFRAASNRGTMIKSPVELIVGTLRLFHVPIRDPVLLVRAGRQLGQDLLEPPNVKGWPGGKAWITASTLLARQQFLQRVLRGEDMPMRAPGPMAPAAGEGRPLSWAPSAHAVAGDTTSLRPALTVTEDRTPGLSPDRLTHLLLPIAPAQPMPPGGEGRSRLEYLVLDPVYQLQ
jgi:uncharacterized protein (DUF1800 family)